MRVKFEVSSGDLAQANVDALIVSAFDNWRQTPSANLKSVDQAMGGALNEVLSVSGDFFNQKVGESLLIHTLGKIPARYVVVVGLGKPAEVKPADIRRAAAAGVRAAQKVHAKTLASGIHGASETGYSLSELSRLAVEGGLLGQYKFTLRKSKSKNSDKKNGSPKSAGVDEITWQLLSDSDVKQQDIQTGQKMGQIIAEHVNLARDWVNDSANHVTPTFLKQQAEATEGLGCHVLDFNAIKKQGMGLFELVAKGSVEPSYVVHLAYKPAKKQPTQKITLVGKGLTFDSGGLSLKPAKSMETMKMDMAGAAVVIAVMKAIAALDKAGYPLDVQVDGFIGTCENMPAGNAAKPGDIVTSLNGKTVEVNNTDAEGRLVLADVLTYAQQKTNPDILIDLATLTGACIVALGSVACGIMGTDDDLIQKLIAAGKPAGEKIWQLPLYEEYHKAIESDYADLINANSQGEAGSQNGGMFLKEFVDEGRRWAHMDIAGPAMISKDYPETPKGATGFGVRTLLYYLYNEFTGLS